MYDVQASADDATSLVACYLLFAARIPEARLAAVGEVLHRINLRTPVGAFELCYDTGRVRFKTGADMEGVALVPHTVCLMLSSGRYLCDLYHAAVMRVAFGDVRPADAIGEVDARLAALESPALHDAEPEVDIDAIIRELEGGVDGGPARSDEPLAEE